MVNKMVNKTLTSPVILVFALTACTTGSDPSSSQTSWMSSNKCPSGVMLKINGKSTPITAPNPFGGIKNPGMEIIGGRFNLGLITKEVGMFELLDFAVSELQSGTFTGDKFRLTLVNSPYKDGVCSTARYKHESKLIIDEYNADTGQLKGCFYGKLDCDGKLVEINAAVSGLIP